LKKKKSVVFNLFLIYYQLFTFLVVQETQFLLLVFGFDPEAFGSHEYLFHIVKPLTKFYIFSSESVVHCAMRFVAQFVNKCDLLGDVVEHYFGSIVENGLDHIVGQTEHYRVPCSYPLHHVDDVWHIPGDETSARVRVIRPLFVIFMRVLNHFQKLLCFDFLEL